jgi:hypothetical protein
MERDGKRRRERDGGNMIKVDESTGIDDSSKLMADFGQIGPADEFSMIKSDFHT